MNVTEIRRSADMERITTPELAQAFIDEQIALIKEQVGEKKVLLALSGGVDSSVVAVLLIKAIGQQLVCVHVNHGLLRKGEPDQVIEVFRNQMNANLIYVDATDRFIDKLSGVADPETKRKIIGGEFIEVFAEEARKPTGIKDGKRVFEWCCIVRAVCSIDVMTANVAEIPHEVMVHITERITHEVAGINRVLYDFAQSLQAL